MGTKQIICYMLIMRCFYERVNIKARRPLKLPHNFKKYIATIVANYYCTRVTYGQQRQVNDRHSSSGPVRRKVRIGDWW